MDKNIQLEALITEREGMLAENQHRISCGNSIAYGMDNFNVIANRIRALDTVESPAMANNDYTAALRVIDEFVGRTDEKPGESINYLLNFCFNRIDNCAE